MGGEKKFPIVPPNFQGVNYSEIRWVRVEKNPPSFAARPSKVKGAKALGLRYERHVQDTFERLSDLYIRSPWLSFQCRNSKPRWCQLDGMFFDIRKGLIKIVEIK